MDIKFKPDLLLGKRKLAVTDEKIIWDDKEICFSQIKRVKFNLTNISIYLIPIKTVYKFVIEDTSGKLFTIAFAKSIFHKPKDMEQIYSQLEDIFYNKVILKEANEIVDQVNEGKKAEIGKYILDKSGLYFTQWGLFKNQERFIAWENLTYQTEMGLLRLFAADNKQINTALSFQNNWETRTLYQILHII